PRCASACRITTIAGLLISSGLNIWSRRMLAEQLPLSGRRFWIHGARRIGYSAAAIAEWEFWERVSDRASGFWLSRTTSDSLLVFLFTSRVFSRMWFGPVYRRSTCASH